MKKDISVLCNIVSAVLVTAFFVKSTFDYIRYSPIKNSAPFSAWVLMNVLYFIIPAIIVFVIGVIVKKK